MRAANERFDVGENTRTDVAQARARNATARAAVSLAEANLTVATAEDKGDVFILAPNDGTARAIALSDASATMLFVCVSAEIFACGSSACSSASVVDGSAFVSR